jgi:hypothetical protein
MWWDESEGVVVAVSVGAFFLSHSAWTLSVFCVTGGRSEKHRPSGILFQTDQPLEKKACVCVYFSFFCAFVLPRGEFRGEILGGGPKETL